MSSLELDLGPTSVLEIRLNDRVIRVVEFQPQRMSVPDAVRVAALAIEASDNVTVLSDRS
jgi:hypothetical protein